MPISDIMSSKRLHIILLPNAFSSLVVSSLLVLRVGDRSEFQSRDSCEVGGIACV